MASCLMTAGKSRTCETRKKIGGLKGRVWAFNLTSADGTKLGYTEAGNVVSAITLQTGQAAYPIDAGKFAHDFTPSVKKPGMNKFYGQNFNLRAITDDATDLTWSDNIVMSDSIVFVVEDMNKRFMLLGQNNGLECQEGDLGTIGQEAESDVTEVYNFTGEEVENKYKFVDVGTGYEDTLTYLIGLETVTP